MIVHHTARVVHTRPYWQLFLDMDGVLMDFVKHFEKHFNSSPREFEDKYGSALYWETIRSEENFYVNIPIMPDAHELIAEVRHLRPIILTGVPRGNWAESQKVLSANIHFPGIPIVTCKSEHKNMYCKGGDILIDDWDKYADKWQFNGGIFIHHVSAKDSIRQLKEIRDISR